MESLKKIGSTLISTPIGTIGGAAGLYFAAKKYAHVENKYALIGIAIVGGLIGSTIEYKIRAKFQKPTINAAPTVKKNPASAML